LESVVRRNLRFVDRSRFLSRLDEAVNAARRAGG
jgi:hypothetical protein